jgi:hypothetical protein
MALDVSDKPKANDFKSTANLAKGMIPWIELSSGEYGGLLAANK